MKKSFLLAAALLVVGSSTMVAKTASTMEKTTLEFKEKVVRDLYMIEIFDINTYETLYSEEFCHSSDEELMARCFELAEYYGGLDNVSFGLYVFDECEL